MIMKRLYKRYITPTAATEHSFRATLDLHARHWGLLTFTILDNTVGTLAAPIELAKGDLSLKF